MSLEALDVAAGDPSWSEVLHGLDHDVYQLPEYARVGAATDGGVPRAVIVRGPGATLLLPYVRREIPGSRWDAVSPYGYPGFVHRPSGDHSAPELLATALSQLRHDGAVSVFLRSHPGLNPSLPIPDQYPQPKSLESPTVVVDLDQTAEQMWGQTASALRNKINRARRAGYHAVIDDDHRWYGHFIATYRANMVALGASAYYLFDDEYFASLRELLGTRLIHVAAVINDEYAGGALFLTCGAWIQYHLSATVSAHRRMSPTKLVLDLARTTGREWGGRWLHLGGGRGGADDSLLHFKADFSPQRLTFHARGVVLDAVEYDRVAGHRAGQATPDYFPSYRA